MPTEGPRSACQPADAVPWGTFRLQVATCCFVGPEFMKKFWKENKT